MMGNDKYGGGYRTRPCLWALLGVLTLMLPLPSVADSFDGEISQAQFTTGLKQDRPVDEVLVLENSIQDLYFYSEVKDMDGKTLVHRWEHAGSKVYEQQFQVSSKIQAMVSKYSLDPDKTGEWMVVITDAKGWPLKAVMFKYVLKGSFAGKGVVPVGQ